MFISLGVDIHFVARGTCIYTDIVKSKGNRVRGTVEFVTLCGKGYVYIHGTHASDVVRSTCIYTVRMHPILYIS